MIHQAKVIAIKGNFDEALTLVREITQKYPVELVNSINPFRIEGQKSAAFEICDTLKDAPEFHAIPVGNAGNITAYWKGYGEYKKAGRSKQLPKMLRFQAAGRRRLSPGKLWNIRKRSRPPSRSAIPQAGNKLLPLAMNQRFD